MERFTYKFNKLVTLYKWVMKFKFIIVEIPAKIKSSHVNIYE